MFLQSTESKSKFFVSLAISNCLVMFVVVGHVRAQQPKEWDETPAFESDAAIDESLVETESDALGDGYDDNVEMEPLDAIPPIPVPANEADMDSNSAQEVVPGELGVRVENDATGVVVRGVIVGAAGSKAGIRPGDRITSIDGQVITSAEDFTQYINSKAAGDVCDIEILRDGAPQMVPAKLEPRVGFYAYPPGNSGYAATHVAPRYRLRSYGPRSWHYSTPYARHYYPPYHVPYYGRYYGTPRFGYHDDGWGRGGLHIGGLRIHW